MDRTDKEIYKAISIALGVTVVGLVISILFVCLGYWAASIVLG